MSKIKEVFYLPVVLFLLFSNSCYPQKQYIGVIRLNDKNKTIISYRLYFKVLNDSIRGHSITDFGGKHETKSLLSGFYNKKTKAMSFKEQGVVYTKSKFQPTDFCFVNFSGKHEKGIIKGSFEGKFLDGSVCINGKVNLQDANKISNKMAKIQNKIATKVNKLSKKGRVSKIRTDSILKKIALIKYADENKLMILSKNEKASVAWNENELYLHIWDAGQIDGDRITITLDGKPLLKNYRIEKEKKVIYLSEFKNSFELKIIALNLGSVSPNTSIIEVLGKKKTLKMLTNLKKNESASLQIIKTNYSITN